MFSWYVLANVNLEEHEILGFRLGMTPNEIETVAEALSLEKYEHLMYIGGDSENPFMYRQEWSSSSTLGNIKIEYTRPPTSPHLQ